MTPGPTRPPALPARPPVEPPATPWALEASGAVPGEDLVGIGADLAPGTVLAAYRAGLFPMGLGEGGGPPLGWWSPDPRGVLEPGALRISRSLRRSVARFELTVDTAFDAVVEGCADPTREGAWITSSIRSAYRRLHDLGWAHSVEAWAGSDGPAGRELVGGLYGIAVGGLFCGESMFHRRTDASKAALVHLVDVLAEDGVDRVVEVQWATDHLRSLGVVEVSRAQYLARLPGLLALPLPQRWR